jgi:hypothetical protein
MKNYILEHSGLFFIIIELIILIPLIVNYEKKNGTVKPILKINSYANRNRGNKIFKSI